MATGFAVLLRGHGVSHPIVIISLVREGTGDPHAVRLGIVSARHHPDVQQVGGRKAPGCLTEASELYQPDTHGDARLKKVAIRARGSSPGSLTKLSPPWRNGSRDYRAANGRAQAALSTVVCLPPEDREAAFGDGLPFRQTNGSMRSPPYTVFTVASATPAVNGYVSINSGCPTIVCGNGRPSENASNSFWTRHAADPAPHRCQRSPQRLATAMMWYICRQTCQAPRSRGFHLLSASGLTWRKMSVSV